MFNSQKASRFKAYTTGLGAETLCRWLLRLKGYGIVNRRYRCPAGEIDIIAVRGKVLALIEVKARASRDLALEAILPRQMQRMERAAQHFLARHPRLNRHDIRFDVMLVTAGRWPRHIMDAWRP